MRYAHEVDSWALNLWDVYHRVHAEVVLSMKTIDKQQYLLGRALSSVAGRIYKGSLEVKGTENLLEILNETITRLQNGKLTGAQLRTEKKREQPKPEPKPEVAVVPKKPVVVVAPQAVVVVPTPKIVDTKTVIDKLVADGSVQWIKGKKHLKTKKFISPIEDYRALVVECRELNIRLN